MRAGTSRILQITILCGAIAVLAFGAKQPGISAQFDASKARRVVFGFQDTTDNHLRGPWMPSPLVADDERSVQKAVDGSSHEGQGLQYSSSSQNARTIAFLLWNGVYRDIWTVKEDGSALTRLTESGWVTSFVWSPDGGEIAYTTTTDQSGLDIFVMEADGTNVRRMTYGARAYSEIDWNGTKIAFLRDTDSYPMVRIAYVDVTDPFHTVVDVSGDIENWGMGATFLSCCWLRWSPDGHWIALGHGTADGVAAADGSIFIDGAKFPQFFNPTWKNDSSHIIYPAPFPNQGISYYDLNNFSFGQLSGTAARTAVYSPDDSYVAYADDQYLRRMNPNDTGHMILAYRRATDLDWSPNGDKVVYASWVYDDFPPLYTGLHVVNADGSAGMQIAQGYSGRPLWQPEVAKYLVSGRVTDANGEPIRGVTISADGASLAMTDANGEYTIVDLPPGTYTLVPTTAGYFWSPESRTITIPPDATGQDFTGRNIQKEVNPNAPNAVEYGDVLDYAVHLVYPETRSLRFRDPVPANTAYIDGSLVAPIGVAYDPASNEIRGTLNLNADAPIEVSFSARVEVTGTPGLAPLIVNQACLHTTSNELVDCDEVFSFSIVWPIYLPAAMW